LIVETVPGCQWDIPSMIPLFHWYMTFSVVVSDLPAQTSVMSGVVRLCFDDGRRLEFGVRFSWIGLICFRGLFARLDLCSESYAALDRNESCLLRSNISFSDVDRHTNQEECKQASKQPPYTRFAASNSCASSSANLFSVARSVSIFLLASSLQNSLRARI
jgi:hypothetical protein